MLSGYTRTVRKYIEQGTFFTYDPDPLGQGPFAGGRTPLPSLLDDDGSQRLKCAGQLKVCWNFCKVQNWGYLL